MVTKKGNVELTALKQGKTTYAIDMAEPREEYIVCSGYELAL